MVSKKSERPWTWAELARIRKSSVRNPQGSRRKLRAFIKTYGDRGIVALMAAGHAPGTWAVCPLEAEDFGPSTSLLGFSTPSMCNQCPLHPDSKWCRGRTLGFDACSEYAMAVYTLMVAEKGLLPEEVM